MTTYRNYTRKARAITVVVLTTVVALCACLKKPTTDAAGTAGSTNQTEASPSPLPFPTDSARLKMTSDAGSAEVYLDYPKGHDAAAREAKAFIRSQLFGDRPTEPTDDAEALARRYCELTLQGFEHSLQQLNFSEVSHEQAPEEGMEIRLVFVSDQYITYESWHYAYFTGGGHGTYGTQGLTIRRSDGKRMNHLAKDSERLRHLMVQGLMDYFGVSDEASLADYLTVPLDLLPMPAHPPYLTADGLRFQYELYDICRMDDGAPAFTIPLDSL